MEGPTGTSFVNAVYYLSGALYRRQEPPSLLCFENISHVFYAFARVTPDGVVYLPDGYTDCQIEVDGELGCLNALTSQKRNHSGLKIVLSIGGGGDGSKDFAEASSTPDKRLVFAQSAKELVDDFNLDGIDIYWEYPADYAEGAQFLQLLAEIRVTLPSPTYIVTAALPAPEWALRYTPLAAVCEYLDFINLMAYDFYGPWSEISGFHAQLNAPTYLHGRPNLSNGSASVWYLLYEGVPANKIVFGIPVYGRSFLGTQYVDQRHSGHGGEDGAFEYRDLPRPPSLEYVDENVVAAFCMGGDGGFVSYDVPRTVRMKATFAKDIGLAGLFYWHASADADGPRSLIKAGFDTLNQPEAV